MPREIANPWPHNECFFCGSASEQGLKLRFFWDEELEEAFADWVPDRRFKGQGDILHGAIQMGLLDEAMGWSCFECTGSLAVTADMNIRFRRPLYFRDKPIRVSCRCLGQDGPRVRLAAELVDDEGTVCTKAEGTFHMVPREKYDALVDDPHARR